MPGTSRHYTTWYEFKKDLEKLAGSILLNQDWLEVKPEAPLPWNDADMRAALSALAPFRKALRRRAKLERSHTEITIDETRTIMTGGG